MASILVVDDEPLIGQTLVRLLGMSGHSAESAESGAEALQILNNRRPDVVLLDMMMPKMSGLDVLRIMNETEQNKDVAVIGYSASDFYRAEALAAGAKDYVLKGRLEWDELRAVIEHWAAK